MSAPGRLETMLGVQHPLVLAPMAGGPSTPALAAAVSRAGGLGSLGAAYLTPEQILAEATAVRRLTDRPYAINLFTPLPPPPSADANPMLSLLAPIHARLGLPPPVAAVASPPDFEAQLAAVLESGAPVFHVTFGMPTADQLARLRRAGLLSIGTATTVEEAQLLESAGFDAIVAQGSEAGGHRGTFVGPFEQGLVGTLALVPQVVDAVRIPVIAAGGIMDGRGWVAAEALGAAGVQLGTAFLRTEESGASAAYREALRSATDDGTAVTRAFSGRPARGLVNAFLTEAEAHGQAILPYPVQNALTRPMRTAAGKAGLPEYLSLWAGQGARLGREGPAEVLVRTLVGEAARVRASLSAVR